MKENGPKLGNKLLELGQGLIGWVAENAGPTIDKLGTWLDSVGTWISETGWPIIRDNFGEWTQATWDWITEDVIPELSSWLDGISGWIDDNYPKVEEAFEDLRPALWNWITGTKVDTETQAAATGFVSSLGGFLVTAVETSEKLTDEFQKTFATVIGAGITRALVEVGILTEEDVAKLPGTWTKVKEVIDGWYDTGKQLASITIDGIVDFFTDNTVIKKVGDAFKSIYGGLFGILGAGLDLIGFNIKEQIPLAMQPSTFESPTTFDVPTMFDPANFGNTYNITVNGALDPVSVGNQIIDIITTNNNRLGYPGGVLT